VKESSSWSVGNAGYTAMTSIKIIMGLFVRCLVQSFGVTVFTKTKDVVCIFLIDLILYRSHAA
jgi:hypothetical protein